MAFLSNGWTKLKMLVKNWKAEQLDASIGSEPDDPLDLAAMEAQLQRIQQTLGQPLTTLSNEAAVQQRLQQLSTLLDAPLEEALDQRAAHIKALIDIPEAYQALRQARWPTGVNCTSCHSSNIRRLPQLPLNSEHNHRYRCLACRLEFNDDDGIAGNQTGDATSISVWMHCWYLMGCTDSLSYIAHCMALDLHHVEWMVERLKTILGPSVTPTFHQATEADAAQKEAYGEHLKADLIAQYQALDTDITGVPVDTGEYRRQQHLRRHLTASTEPAAVIPERNASPTRKP